METLIMMRHAESVFNERGVLNGDATRPGGLTARGRKQAARAADQLARTAIELCVTTNFERSIETADIVLARRDVPRLVVEQLNDPRAGDFELRPYADLDEWQKTNGPEAPLPGTGLTLRESLEDVHQGIASVAARPEATVLLVIHGLAIAWLLKSVGHAVLPDQAVPVFIDGADVAAMIDATALDVLRFWPDVCDDG